MSDLKIIDEEEEEKFEIIYGDSDDSKSSDYYHLFISQGEKKSNKLVNFIMAQVVNNYGEDFNNPERLSKMKTLRLMREPFKRAFGKELI